MICSLSELMAKEVINTKNGERLGFVDDIEFDADTSTVLALVIQGRERIFGLLGRDDDIVISCKEIELIGKDTVLVALSEHENGKSRSKSTKHKRINFMNLYD